MKYSFAGTDIRICSYSYRIMQHKKMVLTGLFPYELCCSWEVTVYEAIFTGKAGLIFHFVMIG